MSNHGKWRMAARELGEFVHEVAPRVALVGVVAVVLVCVPILLRVVAFVPASLW